MGRKLPEIPDFNDLDKILKATSRERDRLMLMLCRFMGLRVSEVCKLEVPHLDFRRKFLKVVQGKGAKDRTLPIPQFLVGPLRGWIGSRKKGPVFQSRQGQGRPMTTRAVQLLVKRLARKAGIDGWDKPRFCTPHKFRHFFASEKVEKGVDLRAVQELLGHESLQTTTVYLHSSPEHLREAIDT